LIKIRKKATEWVIYTEGGAIISFWGPMQFMDKQAALLTLISSYFPGQTLLSILDDARVGLVICDRRFRYKALNRSIAGIHNLPIKALLGHSFHQMLGSLAEKVVPCWENVFATGQPLTSLQVAGWLPKRPSATRWIENIFPLRDSRGRVTQVGSFVIEITSPAMSSSPLSSPTSNAISVTGNRPSSTDRRQRTHLSHREQEVLRLIAEGKSSKEIASALVIGVRTVETYRARLMLKLDVNSSVDLVRYAIRNHIVTL
jgi:DNA-binding CsgD family transcriptional regulator